MFSHVKVLGLLFAAVLAAVLFTAAGRTRTEAAEEPELVREALELYVGEKDKLTLKNDAGTVSWTSSDPAVVTVDSEGNVEGIGTGKATVTVSSADGTAECTVYVVEKEYSFDDNIMISIFWPPTSEYINDEQYKYMADAGITWVMGSGDNLGSKEDQLKMLELCYKYGIHMTVGDGRLGGNLLGMSEEQILKVVDEYRNVPAANGYYMLDEPFNPNVFINAYRVLKTADPNSYMHLNFLPYGSYGSVDTYMSQMNDWLKLCESTGYKQDYLMYDLYPFGLAAGSMNRTGFLINLDAVRKIGLANGVRTGTYIQSVTQSVAFRSPTESETRYEINMALAFGVKQLSYFTWFTPYNRNEPFEDGIITHTGVPNPKYEFICRLNKEVANLGKTLIKCDSLEVYLSRNGYDAMPLIPEDFLLQTLNKKDFTVAYLKNRETGRDYCMVVNNNFSKPTEISVKFDSAIKSLSYISEQDGNEYPLTLESDNSLTFTLEAGACRLFVLPEGYDYSKVHEWQPQAGENYALHGQVHCDSSEGSNGWYIDNLNDGNRFSKGGDNGWRSTSGSNGAEIVLDLGRELKINRIDLYPAGDLMTYGEHLPKNFTVAFSRDGETWYKIAEANDLTVLGTSVPSLKFQTVTARYVRILVTGFNGDVVELAEIEVYDDDGSVGEPESVIAATRGERGTNPVKYKTGISLALNKPVTASSYPAGQEFKGWGWWPDFVVDGNYATGWTSNIKIHNSANSTEYCVIDLQDVFTIDTINVFPLGCWPINFTIQVSEDQQNWTTVADVTNCKVPKTSYDVENIGVKGRYVMFRGTKLRATAADGYMLQLADIAVYGKPYKDEAEAKARLADYVAAGGSTDSELYKAAEAVLADPDKTQSQLDAALKELLESVSLKLPDLNGGNEAAVGEYSFKYEKLPEETIDETTPVPTGLIDDTEKRGSLKPYIIGGISALVLATAGVLIAVLTGKKRKKKEQKEEK